MKINETAGRKAERSAATYLEAQGHEILHKNWRTKWCEIDIISRTGKRKQQVIHFTEVKYRKSSLSDSMLAVTSAKVSQLEFAAQLWIQEHATTSASYQIDVVAVSGEELFSFRYIENITG